MLPNRYQQFLSALTLTFLAGGPRASAERFTIEDWILSTRVDNAFAGMSDNETSFRPQNPFNESHSVTIGMSFATTTYDFAWDELFGDFLIQGSHEAEDVPESTLFARSSGSIWISTSEDLEIAIDADYSFNAPAPGFYARLKIDLIDLSDNSVAFFDLEDGGPWALGPPVDTLSIDGNVIAPAGSTYLLGYEMSLHSFASGTDVIATGSGTAHLTLQAIPESSTMSMLALVGLLACARRRRRPRPTR